MNTAETIIHCERCGARCRCDGSSNPDAKMLRRSKEPKGLCVNCAVHDWLRNTYPINMQLAESGPGILVHPHIRELFADIMRVGHADADPDEINWNLINENWDLPFPHKIKPTSTNPCTQKELEDIAAGKKHPFTNKPHISVVEGAKLMKQLQICETFEELNEVKPGLGDKLQNLIEDSKEKIMKDVIQKTQEPHRVKCVLTADEKAEAAMELANTYQAMESLAIERKTAMSEFKQRKEKLEEQIHVTSLMVKEGVAMRSVPCELQLNYSKQKATIIRLDTEEIVEEREMTDDEKQMRLEFEKNKKSKKGMKKKVETEEMEFEGKK